MEAVGQFVENNNYYYMTLKGVGFLERGWGPCWQEIAIFNRMVRESHMEIFFKQTCEGDEEVSCEKPWARVPEAENKHKGL